MINRTRPPFALAAPWLLTVCLLTGSAAHAQGQSANAPWVEAPYSQFVKGKTLERVLADFAASFSLGVSLPKGLEVPVSGRYSAGNPTEFLNRLGRQYGLTWYVHGGALYIGRTRDTVVRSLQVPTVGSNSSVRQVLTDLQVFEPRFGWSEIPEQGMAIVTGPRSYVDLVERTINSLPQAPGGQQVVMFRLRYAPVDDRVISYRDREILVPGVATTLRNLMQTNVPGPVRAAGAGAPASLNNMANTLGGGRNGSGGAGAGNMGQAGSGGMGFAADAGNPMGASGGMAGPGAVASGMGSGGAGGSAAGNASGFGPGNNGAGAAGAGGFGNSGGVSLQNRPRPSIQSDARLNAIIVQDAPDRIPLYTSLIAQMDVPAPLIEIEALIVDVNTTRLEELGIGWGSRLDSGKSAIGFGAVTTTPDSNTISITNSNLPGVSPTTAVLDTAGRYLMARIRALEQKGDASVQARPSIITSENIGAVIDLSETVYIQTTAERTALVTPVTAGTTLRVTPRLSRRGESQAIFMTVDIEDGQVQYGSAGALPSIRKGVVSTEATLSGEESLLIGGYNSEQRVAGSSKVPVLGNLPGLGALFSSKSDSVQRRERLFLLKARVVMPKVAVGAATGDGAPKPEPVEPAAVVGSAVVGTAAVVTAAGTREPAVPAPVFRR